MKKILLMISETHGYETKIEKELINQGYEVEVFDALKSKYGKARKIKNPFLRIYNDKYLKKYKKINLKDELEGKEILKDLEKLDYSYDIFLKIGCVYLPKNVLEYLKNRIPICISHHWDSSIKVDRCNFELERRYFDKISSFDKEDVTKFHLEYLPNFYCLTEKNLLDICYDIYTIINKTEEKREKLLYKIAEECIKNNITYDLTLYNSKILENRNGIIKITRDSISLDSMLEKESKAKAVLELLHSLNKGCTFRTFDCIGMKKKLITTNKEIINEDFYNPNNILVIDEENINIPKEFIDSPYEELPKEIYEKYSLENWVKQLLDVK